MAKGERRYKPPEGYITSTQAIKLLGKQLYQYVEEKRVRKVSPPGHKHGFYHAGDVQKILEQERNFAYTQGQWKQRASSTFERATADDMVTIDAIDRATFGEPAAPLEIQSSWRERNPDTFYVLRHGGQIVGYASALPLKRELIDRYIRDQIDGEQIAPDDVLTYEPGQAYDLYIMAIVVSPQITGKEKRQFGAALERGIFSFLLDLARHGIEIRSLWARSYKQDGIRLMQKMGFLWARSPVPHKNLFILNVAESGNPTFVEYSTLLEEWRSAHQPAPPSPRKPRPTAPQSVTEVTSRPPDAITLKELADELGVDRTTLWEQVRDYGLEHTTIPLSELGKPGKGNERFFTPAQVEKVKAWRATRPSRGKQK